MWGVRAARNVSSERRSGFETSKNLFRIFRETNVSSEYLFGKSTCLEKVLVFKYLFLLVWIMCHGKVWPGFVEASKIMCVEARSRADLADVDVFLLRSVASWRKPLEEDSRNLRCSRGIQTRHTAYTQASAVAWQMSATSDRNSTCAKASSGVFLGNFLLGACVPRHNFNRQISQRRIIWPSHHHPNSLSPYACLRFRSFVEFTYIYIWIVYWKDGKVANIRHARQSGIILGFTMTHRYA
jgi:hypothetical protein